MVLPINHNVATERSSSTNSNEHDPSKKMSPRTVGILALVLATGISVGTLLGIESGNKNSSADKLPGAIPPITEKQTTVTSTEKQPSIPSEAKSFVNEFGNRYADPVSTYYATEEYKAKHDGTTPIMTDSYIKNYSPRNDGETVSDLGFTFLELPLDVTISQETSMNIFNTYTAKILSEYMNHIAKNPSPEAMAIIDAQYHNYQFLAKEKSSAASDKLLNTVRNIALKYGSTANYSIAQASNDDNPDATQFNNSYKPLIDAVDSKGRVMAFSDNGVNLLVNIDTHDGKNTSKIKEIIKNVQLSVDRQPIKGPKDNPDDFTYVTVGQR